ncbi:MAG TPA: amino acid adenylation domain-containing protein, partial [Longimicrobiaceae bacterium]
MMDPVAERLAERVRGLRLAPPEIPFVSDVTGTWITADEAVSPDYWTRHLCRTVRFAEGMEEVLRGDRLLLEVGPGRTLGTIALQAGAEEGAVFASLRHAYTQRPDEAFLLETLGRLWMAGARVDWTGFAGEERRRRVPLPTYPFERQRFWVERRTPDSARRRRDTGRGAEGLWVPGWRRTAPPVAENGAGRWLVLLDSAGVGEALALRLAEAGRMVATAGPAEDIPVLLDTLAASGRLPDRVVDLRPLTCGTSPLAVAALARSLPEAAGARIRLVVVTRGAYEVTDEDALDPAAACIHGLCEAIPREHRGVACRAVDLPSGDPPLDALAAEVAGAADDAVVALRGASRWVRSWERVRTPAAPARVPGGTYLFLGSRGPAAPLAERLAGSAGAAVRFADVAPGDGEALRALLREDGGAPVGVVYTPEGGAEREGLRRVEVELAALEDALAGAPLRFCLLQGTAAEPAAAALLEGVAGRRRLGSGDPWTAVRWGAAAPAADDLERVLSHVLGVSAEPQLAVSRRNPCARPVLPPREEPAEAAGSAPRYRRPVLAGEYVAPGTETERRVAAVWEELLLIGQIGVHDDFFSLGGHSILATQILGRLRETLRAEVTLRQVFENPTIAGLAALVDALAPAGSRREYPPIVPVPRDRPLVLSFGQERMWLLCTREPDSPLYNVSDLQRMAGRLDAGALGQALAETIRRHEVLRTAFRETGGVLEQVPVAARGVSLTVVDLTGLPREEREPEMWRRLPESVRRAIDLATAVRIRAHLFRLDEEEHAFLRVLHHAVVDGWSSQVFWHDMAALYGAFARGLPSPLAEPEIQYADYAAWQREWMQGETLDELLGFWTRELEGAPRFLDLPTDRPYPAVEDHSGSTIVLHVSRELTDRLQALAYREGATLYMVMFAVYQLVLHRWTGQDDMLVGALVANRSHPQTHGLMGYFLNTVALRARMEGSLVFRDHLARVREATLRTDDHQDLPFDLLLQELRPERDASRSPLVQTMFVLQQRIRHGAAPAVLPGLELSTEETDPGTAKFEIGLLADELDGEITLLLTYQSSIFDRSTAVRFSAHYRAALEAVAGDAGQRLSAVPVMDETEVRQVLYSWNGADTGYAGDRCLHELVHAQVLRTPHAPALRFAGQSLSYDALFRRACRFAHLLRERGVGPEVRAAICMEPTPEAIVSVLGVLLAGGAYLPIDPELPSERRDFLVEDGGPVLLLTQTALAGRLAGCGLPVLCVDDEAERIDAQSDAVPASGVGPRNLAYVIYTSGSTGRPKGVLVEHAGVGNTVLELGRVYGSGPGDRNLLFAPLHFDSSVGDIFLALTSGATLVVAGRDAMLPGEDGLLRLLREERITHMKTTSSALAALPWGPLPELRSIVTGGEVCTAGLIRTWGQERNFFNGYGATEASIRTTSTVYKDPERDPPIGHPAPNTQLYVLDALLEPVPFGVAGEIYIGGAGVVRGYLNRPELTAERFLPDPYRGASGARLYRTGDKGRRRADGEVEFLGRVDFQVKIRGYRVEPGEIEAALREDPPVREAVVLLRDDAGGDPRLVAYVVPEAGERVSTSELRGRLGGKLPGYMVPGTYVVLERLPLTANGKVDRRALPAPERGPEEEFVGPRTAAEELLAGIWAEVLRVERVGVEDNFFVLGGHSLLATQVVSRARQAFGVEVPLRALFEAPTVSALAGRIEALRSTAASAAPIERFPRECGEGVPLSFAQQRLWVVDRLEPGSAAYNMAYALRLYGALDTGVLRASLDALVRRHETLRTTFAEQGGVPVQVVHPPACVALPELDLRRLPEAERTAGAERLAEEEALRPFDLARGPLLRSTLIRVGETDHVLCFTLHHIVSDGWSRDVLVREVSALYAAARLGRPAQLPELPVQYADYAVWQREWLSGEVLDEQIGYWRDRLSGAPPLLEIATDRPRAIGQSPRAESHTFVLSPELSQRLRVLSRREGA